MQLKYDSDKITYVFDTSALIKLESTFKHDNPIFKALWDEIEELIKSGQLKIIDFVEEEINDYEGKEDFLKKWIQKFRKAIVEETNEEVLNAAKPIINAEHNTGFFDPKKQAAGKEEADPYLIAYCLVHGCTLVTNESVEKPNKIPKVAEKHGVRAIGIYEFMKERGLELVKRNTEKKEY